MAKGERQGGQDEKKKGNLLTPIGCLAGETLKECRARLKRNKKNQDTEGSRGSVAEEINFG